MSQLEGQTIPFASEASYYKTSRSGGF
jgi:hypothetical protein